MNTTLVLWPGDDNFTSNDTGNHIPCAELFGPLYHRTWRIVIIGTMILCSLLGNTLVCTQLLCRQRRLSKPQILFLNLAISDLLVTLITMTSQLVWELMGRNWVAGDVFCRCFKVMQTFALVSSTYMLVGIALDRYFAIVRPLSPSPHPSKLAMYAWLVALLPSLPNLYVFRQVEVSANLNYCSSIFYVDEHPKFHRQLYMAFVFLSIFIIPFSLLIALYARILLAIWRPSTHIDQRSGSTLPKAKVKTLKLAVVIFTAFMVTNLPYVVQEMILAFGHSGMLNTSAAAFLGVISASNSALNPYIYLAFQSKASLAGRWRSLVKHFRSGGGGSGRGLAGMGQRLSLTLRSQRTSLTSLSVRNNHRVVAPINGRH